MSAIHDARPRTHCVPLPAHATSSQLCHFIDYISSIPDMSRSPSASFLLFFNAALKDYQNQTGMSLVDHPLAKQLEECNSMDSISSLIQEKAQRIRDFRGENGKIMESLKRAVHVVYTFSASTVLGEGIGLVRYKPFTPNFLSLMLTPYSIAIPTCKGCICCVRSLALRKSHFVIPMLISL